MEKAARGGECSPLACKILLQTYLTLIEPPHVSKRAVPRASKTKRARRARQMRSVKSTDKTLPSRAGENKRTFMLMCRYISKH